MNTKPRLEVRDLELVLALASTGSTVAAAERLHITQSAVSRALILAEERIGVQLFERKRRGLLPTHAGERLIGGAGRLLEQWVELERQITAPPIAPQRLKLVCQCYTAYRWLPSTLARLPESLSNLDVQLAVEHTEDPLAALKTRKVDIALLASSNAPAPLRELPLFHDEIVFLVADNHPLAKQKTLTSKDLLGHTLISSTQTPQAEASWFMRQVFGARQPRLKYLRFPLTEAVIDATRAGLGVAALSGWIVEPYLDDGLCILRLRGKPLRRSWTMAFPAEYESAARGLASALLAAAPEPHPRRLSRGSRASKSAVV
ncbi:MAG: LysR family transcriptional regulator [Polyangiaceae bacterium]|nr:LysR family transcriptional regulator [Polyangiaceae bacterium]MCB9607469.1 LysR family transcriptional regulator [Polyangiaceae bacterium]